MRRIQLLLSLLLLVLAFVAVGCVDDDDDDAVDDDDATGDDDDATSDDDDATSDDDDATGDDDDATGDDDDATSDDDDATSDDDDSAAPVVPCQDPPPLDTGEWTAIPGGTLVFEGQGAWPDDGAQSWIWLLTDDAAATAQYDELGPISGLTLPQMLDSFDEATEDLVVITWWQNADGECFAPQGLYWNNLMDCICAFFWLHHDSWEGGMLPAKSHTTQVWSYPDLGFGSPDSGFVGVHQTDRVIPTP